MQEMALEIIGDCTARSPDSPPRLNAIALHHRTQAGVSLLLDIQSWPEMTGQELMPGLRIIAVYKLLKSLALLALESAPLIFFTKTSRWCAEH